MEFNATFNNISVISWRSVLLVRKPEYLEKTNDLVFSERISKLHTYTYIFIDFQISIEFLTLTQQAETVIVSSASSSYLPFLGLFSVPSHVRPSCWLSCKIRTNQIIHSLLINQFFIDACEILKFSSEIKHLFHRVTTQHQCHHDRIYH